MTSMRFDLVSRMTSIIFQRKSFYICASVDRTCRSWCTLQTHTHTHKPPGRPLNRIFLGSAWEWLSSGQTRWKIVCSKSKHAKKNMVSENYNTFFSLPMHLSSTTAIRRNAKESEKKNEAAKWHNKRNKTPTTSIPERWMVMMSFRCSARTRNWGDT